MTKFLSNFLYWKRRGFSLRHAWFLASKTLIF